MLSSEGSEETTDDTVSNSDTDEEEGGDEEDDEISFLKTETNIKDEPVKTLQDYDGVR